MHWKELLINVISGAISGFIVNFVCNFLIVSKIEKRERYNDKLLLSLLFFEQLEANINKIDNEELIKKLTEYRHLYEKDTELKNAFNSVDIDLSNMLRLKKCYEKVSYKFNNEKFLEFKYLLEKRIKR